MLVDLKIVDLNMSPLFIEALKFKKDASGTYDTFFAKLKSFSFKLDFIQIFMISIINSEPDFKCFFPYITLYIKDFVQFNSLKQSFTQIYFTFKLILLSNKFY